MDKNRITTILLAVLVMFAAGVVLKIAQPIILPLIIAWLLSYLLGPIVDVLRKIKMPTGLSVAIVLLMLFVFCFFVGVFLNARISVFAEAFPKYQERLMALFFSFTESTHLPSDILSKIDWTERAGGLVMAASGSMLNFLSKLLMVVFFLVFLLLGRPYVKYKMEKAFSPANAEKIINVMRSISSQIGKYLALQFFISLATGLCVWLALIILGVDFPVTWGALAFFLNFIPTVGSIAASIPPILVALVQFPSFWPAVFTLIVLLVIQMTIGNIISPKIMGDRLHLSPMIVLVSLVFWGWLWGFMGALLSVPIASAIKIVCENIEALRPISVMMGSGRSYAREENAL